MKQVLFLCTGNYYRSRFSEVLFNRLAEQSGLDWRADSAGLAPWAGNEGPISRYTLAALDRLAITCQTVSRFPRKVTVADFESSHLVIAVKEAEHRAMVQGEFPQFLETVEFWHVHDLDCAQPDETIADLHERVSQLVLRLTTPASDSTDPSIA